MTDATRPLQRIRTWLYVPGNQRAKLDKALGSGADALLADLEDAVSADRRPQAVTELKAWLDEQPPRHRSRPSPQIWIRVEAAPDDAQLGLARHPAVDGVCLPKAEDPAVIASLCAALADREVMLLVETARGVLRCTELAAVDQVGVVQLGEQDLRADLALPPVVAGAASVPEPIRAARAAVVLASAAAGLVAPVAPVAMTIDDAEGLVSDTAHFRREGFGSHAVVHPRHIAPVLAGLAPTPDEIGWARAVVDADRRVAAEGLGVTVVDGRMVDAPVVAQARAVLRLAGRRDDEDDTGRTAS
jgi:citrate lyase subunit beta/citryl-CoA lyase